MGSAERALRLRGGARTSTGQVRENNEDNLHMWARDLFLLAVVADGMGGAAAGEEASRIAVEAVENGMNFFEQVDSGKLETMTDHTIIERMRDVIRAANLNIVKRASANPELRGMGTTVTMALVRTLERPRGKSPENHVTRPAREIQVLVAHVGDSRAYIIDSQSRQINQITADHSFVEALVAAGHLTQEQAEDHPMRNVLYRALGQNEDIDVDMYEARLHTGDRLVLCSDGLTRHVKPAEIAEITLAHDDPNEAAQSLINLANERGGEDNVSVVVVILEGPNDDDSTIELRMLVMNDDEDTRVIPNAAIAAVEDDTVKAVRIPPSSPNEPHESGGEGHDPSAPPQ